LPKTTTWELPPHSGAKHLLLRRYLEAWYPKLANSAQLRGGGQLNYIDAFAGPGIYSKGEPGSPIIALTTLLNHVSFPKWGGVRFLMYFVDADEDRIESLKVQVDKVWSDLPGGKPKNIEVEIKLSSFLDLVGELKQISSSKNKSFYPTFAFVDPFGFKGLPLADLCDLLRKGSCDVMFNFMYDAINRWCGTKGDQNQASFELLFDGTRHLDVNQLEKGEREPFLHSLIEDTISEHGHFDFVRHFKMEGSSARTLYTLFFATRHIEGLRVMKDAMWSVDPTNGNRFSDRLVKQPSLFEGAPDYDNFAKILTQRFGGGTTSIENLEMFTLKETRFKESHLRQHVLMPLEGSGLIQLTNPKKGRQSRHFPAGSMIKFLTPHGDLDSV
jgi:three-Cys-motif partner protein